MKSFQSRTCSEKLLEEVEKLKFELDGSGAKMAFKACQAPGRWINETPEIQAALDEISLVQAARVLYVMVNIVPPSVTVPIHTDRLLAHPSLGEHPLLERWHLPIKTNVQARFWSEFDGEIYMPAKYWHGPVQYWLQHNIWNNGMEERIHLVCDLDKPWSEK